MTGVFWGTLDFGGGVLTSAGDREAYVAKLSPSGDHLWSHRFGGNANDQGTGVAVDGAGNVIVGGSFQGSVDFGSGAVMSAGGYDAFVVKLDTSGAFLWGKSFGAKGNQEVTSVAADSAGNIAIAGTFLNTVDFGGGPFMGSLMHSEVFLVKLDPSGAHVWSQHFSSPSDAGPPDVAIDSKGNIVLAARVGSLVIAKLDPSGAQIFSKDFPVSPTQLSVAVDPAGAVLLAGQFDGTADFGGGPLTANGPFSDAFVSKLDPMGGHVWSQRYGDGEQQRAAGIAVDPAGNVLVTGGFDGTIDFGGGAIAAEPGGFQSIFVAKLTPDGGHIWSKGVGNIDGINEGDGIAADALGHALVTGKFGGSIDFGSGPITGMFEDVFAAKLSP